ncbi:hypothetical protein IFM89_027477 [Coptis chinensis]|nr:hypothetical protein IFM89_027477 [Coptis chinensis]
MHATQFSYPPISGPSSLPVMTSSSLQMFGPPGHGIPTPMPRAPFIPLSGEPSTKPAMLPLVPGVANPVEVPNAAVPSSWNT